MGKETKEKTSNKKKIKKIKEDNSLDLYESIRQVIKDQKPLTPDQVKQFLSGVITGEIVDSLTKRGAMMNDKISASKLLLDVYQKEKQAEKEEQEIKARTNTNSASTELTKELLLELNNRKVIGVEDDKQEEEQEEQPIQEEIEVGF